MRNLVKFSLFAIAVWITYSLLFILIFSLAYKITTSLFSVCMILGFFARQLEFIFISLNIWEDDAKSKTGCGDYCSCKKDKEEKILLKG